MCMKAQCSTCGKTTWRGCGRHVEQVMKDVKEEDKCKCGETKTAAVSVQGGGKAAGEL